MRGHVHVFLKRIERFSVIRDEIEIDECPVRESVFNEQVLPVLGHPPTSICSQK